MIDPDSPLSVIRQWLSAKIDTHPKPGTAWCVGCSLNKGETFIIYSCDPELIVNHVSSHPPNENVRIRAAQK
jgi:hypothetical protein